MCLYVDKLTTLLELKRDFTTVTFFKWFIPKGSHLLTPYRDFKITKPGLVTLPDTRGPLLYEEIVDGFMVQGRAFHARTNEAITKRDKFYAEFFDKGDGICLPIEVRKEDIICFGLEDHVSVSAYNISEESWKLIKGFK